MTLLEFLRQWQRGRLTAAVLASVLLHALLLVALIGVKPYDARSGTKRGDALIVELGKEQEPAAAGPPGAPAARPASPAPTRSAAAKAAAKPTARAEVRTPVPRTPAPPPAPRPPAAPTAVPPPPAPQPRVASAAPPAAPAAPTVPGPVAPDTPAPHDARAPEAARGAGAAPVPPPAAERQVAAATSGATGGGRAFVPDIRSLRGAGGVHGGGGGDGRGGVEGDPVSLDNPDPRYADYLLRVKRQIEEKMTYPCVKDSTATSCDYKSAQLVLEFGIRKDGELAFVQLRRAAEYPVFDDVSANAIKLASPFPPLPDAIRRLHPTGLPISAHFRYEFMQSFRSIIR